MKRSLILLVPCLLFASSTSDGAAPERTSRSAPPETEVIQACRPGAPDFVKARRGLEAIGDRIEALAPSDTPKAEYEALIELLAGPCFGLAPHWPSWTDTEPETAFALQNFWEAGGESWVAQFLELDAPSPVYSWTVPTLRKTLGANPKRNHSLAPLLCPLGEDECGVETRGWELRARSAFEGFAYRKSYGELTREREEPAPPSRHQCSDLAVEKPRLDRWSIWMNCLQETEAKQDALPLGHMRSPEVGWWFLQGRRGHHFFCDEIRAYHLGTGTAFVVSSCSRLVLRRDGSVDGDDTNSLRKTQTRVGQLPLAALREAAWMAFLAPEVQEDVVLFGTGTALPPEISPVKRSVQGRGLGGFSFSGSSGQTRLDWSWSRGPSQHHSGNLVWPQDDNRAGYDHAVKLLQIAEANFVESCPRAALPSWLIDRIGVDQTSPGLIANLRALMETELCSE
jgi:hypothetical protein